MRILLIGDSCTDVFQYGTATRLCPEAPVPVFTPERKVVCGGMVYNVGHHLVQMGWSDYDLKVGETKSFKTRYIDTKTNHMFLRVDEDDRCLTPFDDKEFFSDDVEYDAVVISDYGKGFLSQRAIETLIHRIPYSFVDTKKELGGWLELATFVKVNMPEWKRSQAGAMKLRHNLIVTDGENGCIFKGKTFPPPKVERVVDSSGAGDVFLAGLVVKYLETKQEIPAIQYAMEMAAQVVKVRGVQIK